MRASGRFVTVLVVAWLLLCAGVVADDSCGQAGNLTHNCNFDNFVDRGGGAQTPDGWMPWVTMGSPAFDADFHGSAPGAPAQRIWSDGGTWTAGLFQQVQVTPGKGYLARIQWAAPNCDGIERRVGIDPLGGTDPLAPRVVWGASSWEKERMPNLQVSSYAQAGTITVFVWTHHGMSSGADQVFLDGVILIEDPSMAPQPTNTPTALPTPTPKPTKPPTPRPPTATPIPATNTVPPPSATPVETAMPDPTEPATETPTPTATATLTPSDTPTPAPPTNTPLPTRTPLPTVVPVARMLSDVHQGPASGSAPVTGASSAQGNPVLLYVAGLALLGMVVSGGVGAWMWRRRRQVPGEPEE